MNGDAGSRAEAATRRGDMSPDELADLREGYVAMREQNLRMARAVLPAFCEVLHAQGANRLRGSRRRRILTGGLEA